MATDATERRAELRRRIQQLQTSLSQLDARAGLVADVEAGDEVTLDTMAQKLGDTERRLLNRFNAAEKFLVNQLDEQLLGSILMVGLFILTAFYVFYFLMENMLRLRRCRCPDVSLNDWTVVLRAARYQCEQENTAKAAAAAVDSGAPATVAAVPAACAASGSSA